jgi:hypothetical protein
VPQHRQSGSRDQYDDVQYTRNHQLINTCEKRTYRTKPQSINTRRRRRLQCHNSERCAELNIQCSGIAAVGAGYGMHDCSGAGLRAADTPYHGTGAEREARCGHVRGWSNLAEWELQTWQRYRWGSDAAAVTAHEEAETGYSHQLSNLAVSQNEDAQSTEAAAADRMIGTRGLWRKGNAAAAEAGP